MPFHLAAHDLPGLSTYLRERGVLAGDEAVVAASPAGAGNMNLTLRVTTPQRSLIVKQARPWVERYPHIAAPVARSEVEAAFYAAVAPAPAVADRMPRLLHHDAAAHVIVLQDLGQARDYADLYDQASLTAGELDGLLAWLDALHALPVSDTARFANRSMRSLNHEHIFDLPFRADADLGLDGIQPGLAELAQEVAADAALVDAITDLGDAYLDDGTHLLHGDFYPGSWLRTDDGPRIIDPEFAFLGDPAFDHGVLAAHLELTGHGGLAQQVLQRTPGARAYAGVEILRRILGVAQLPLQVSLSTRRHWVHLARQWVRASP